MGLSSRLGFGCVFTVVPDVWCIHAARRIVPLRGLFVMLLSIHHAAIICSNYAASKRFYVGILGLKVIRESYREARQSFKLDLALPDGGQVELFSFPGAPTRPSYPEALGLRHLAFAVKDVEESKAMLEARGVKVEPVRVDAYTNKRFVFFADPDGLPLELYENNGEADA